MKTTFYLLIILAAVSLSSCMQNNYSEATIAAFFDLDRSLRQSCHSLQWQRDYFLREMMEIEKTKIQYRPIIEQAKKATEATKEFQSYIHKLRQTLVEQTGGYFTEKEALALGKPYLVLRPRGYQEKELIRSTFLGQDSVGYKIQTKFQALIDIYLQLTAELWDKHALRGTVFRDLTLKEKYFGLLKDELQDKTFYRSLKQIPNNQTWVKFTFDDKSLASLYPLLRQFEHDALLTQVELLNFLRGQLASTYSCNFGSYQPPATANLTKPAILKGTIYEAAISLNGNASESEFKVSVNGKELPIEAGKAMYRTQSNTVGEQEYTARFSVTNPLTGEVETFSKVFRYEVLPNCMDN